MEITFEKQSYANYVQEIVEQTRAFVACYGTLYLA